MFYHKLLVCDSSLKFLRFKKGSNAFPLRLPLQPKRQAPLKSYINKCISYWLIDMPLEKKLHRLDFIMKVEKIIDETTEELVARVHLIPNPERYDFAVVNGEEGY